MYAVSFHFITWYQSQVLPLAYFASALTLLFKFDKLTRCSYTYNLLHISPLNFSRKSFTPRAHQMQASILNRTENVTKQKLLFYVNAFVCKEPSILVTSLDFFLWGLLSMRAMMPLHTYYKRSMDQHQSVGPTMVWIIDRAHLHDTIDILFGRMWTIWFRYF